MPLSWIDGSLYPDTEIPDDLPTLADRVDFLVRLCGAWDFGILPDWETVEEIRRSDWQEAVDETNLLTSPVYHLLRTWHHLQHRSIQRRPEQKRPPSPRFRHGIQPRRGDSMEPGA